MQHVTNITAIKVTKSSQTEGEARTESVSEANESKHVLTASGSVSQVHTPPAAAPSLTSITEIIYIWQHKPSVMLPFITLRPFHYRSEEALGLDLNGHLTLEKEIRKLKGIRWCGVEGWWYVPLCRESYERIKEFTAPFAVLDARWLCQYLEQRRAAQAAYIQGKKVTPRRVQQFLTTPLCPENQQALKRYTELLQLKAYSGATHKTYTGAFYQLLRILGQVPVCSLTKERVQAYLLWLLREQRYSETNLHTTINALKFYFEQVEGKGGSSTICPAPKSHTSCLPSYQKRRWCR